jgi:diacylglycerol kinase (ATP)
MKRFSLIARFKSIKYACEGIGQFFREEHNAWIHLAGTVFVIILVVLLKPSQAELLALVLVTGLVWVTELFNTAIEGIMDFVSVKKHPQIKFIKDVSAAAVLVMAIVALVTGAIVFIPKIMKW